MSFAFPTPTSTSKKASPRLSHQRNSLVPRALAAQSSSGQFQQQGGWRDSATDLNDEISPDADFHSAPASKRVVRDEVESVEQEALSGIPLRSKLPEPSSGSLLLKVCRLTRSATGNLSPWHVSLGDQERKLKAVSYSSTSVQPAPRYLDRPLSEVLRSAPLLPLLNSNVSVQPKTLPHGFHSSGESQELSLEMHGFFVDESEEPIRCHMPVYSEETEAGNSEKPRELEGIDQAVVRSIGRSIIYINDEPQ